MQRRVQAASTLHPIDPRVRESGDRIEGEALSGQDLSGRDFRRQVLINLNLKGAKLRGADLTEAVICGGDFSGADLTGVRLDRAAERREARSVTCRASAHSCSITPNAYAIATLSYGERGRREITCPRLTRFATLLHFHCAAEGQGRVRKFDINSDADVDALIDAWWPDLVRAMFVGAIYLLSLASLGVQPWKAVVVAAIACAMLVLPLGSRVVQLIAIALLILAIGRWIEVPAYDRIASLFEAACRH